MCVMRLLDNFLSSKKTDNGTELVLQLTDAVILPYVVLYSLHCQLFKNICNQTVVVLYKFPIVFFTNLPRKM